MNFFSLSIYRYLIFFSQVLSFTSVELNRFAKQAKLLKKPLFQKRRWSCDFDFPARKTPVAQKHRAVSCQEKIAFSTPSPSSCLGTPLPLPQSVHGRAGRRTYADVTTKISWIERLPNMFSNGAPLSFHEFFNRHLMHFCNPYKISYVNVVSS